MRLITRYIIREHTASFFGSLLLIVFIFTLNFAFQVLGKIMGKGLSSVVILEYFLLNMAWILALAVPMAVLIATLMAFGRLAGDNEITALKSSGINLVTLMRPIFLLAVLLAGLLIGFNNSVLPAFNHRAKMLRKSIYQKQPTMKMEESVFQFDIPGYVFLAKEIDHLSGELKRLTIFDESEKQRRSTILAEAGKLHFDEETAEFTLRLSRGEIHRIDRRQEDNYATIAYDSALFHIEAPDMLLQSNVSRYRGSRELAIPQMLERIAHWQEHPQRNARRIRSYQVEIHKKFSIPFACLVFVLIGAVLGMRAGMGNLAVSSGLSLAFFLIYWIFLMGGEDLADRGFIPPGIAMWLPNVLLGAFGVYLVYNARREGSPLRLPGLLRRKRRPQPPVEE